MQVPYAWPVIGQVAFISLREQASSFVGILIFCCPPEKPPTAAGISTISSVASVAKHQSRKSFNEAAGEQLKAE